MLAVNSQRCLRQTGEQRLDLDIVDGFARFIRIAAFNRAFGQELHRPHAVAPDGFQKAVEIRSRRAHALGDAASHCLPVRQQIVEYRCDPRAAIDPGAQRQGQGNSKAMLPCEPGFVIPETDRTVRRFLQTTDKTAIDQHVERDMSLSARHG